MPDDDHKPPTLVVRPADEYEAAYMGDGGQIIYRDKIPANWIWHAIIGGIWAFSMGAILLSGWGAGAAAIWPLAISGLLTTLMMFALWALFAVLRVTVSDEHVHIQYGLFGPKIAMSAIDSAEAVDYDWKKFGGWGIRRARDGEWAYNMVGDAGRAVRIRHRDGDKLKSVLVASKEPEALATAIAKARSGGRVRVRQSAVRVAEADPVAEAEAEAERMAAAENENSVQ